LAEEDEEAGSDHFTEEGGHTVEFIGVGRSGR
jgi:hypothetical protein